MWLASNGHAALLVALQSIAAKSAPVLRQMAGGGGGGGQGLCIESVWVASKGT